MDLPAQSKRALVAPSPPSRPIPPPEAIYTDHYTPDRDTRTGKYTDRNRDTDTHTTRVGLEVVVDGEGHHARPATQELKLHLGRNGKMHMIIYLSIYRYIRVRVYTRAWTHTIADCAPYAWSPWRIDVRFHQFVHAGQALQRYYIYIYIYIYIVIALSPAPLIRIFVKFSNKASVQYGHLNPSRPRPPILPAPRRRRSRRQPSGPIRSAERARRGAGEQGV